MDHVSSCAANTVTVTGFQNIGDIFILPDTYVGSYRYMNKIYQDALAIKRVTGSPDLFITMTCNPKWPELLRVLEYFPSGTTCLDIPVLTCRLFNSKLRLLINDIHSGDIFAKIISYFYTIEFQKRGLPHAHITSKFKN